MAKLILAEERGSSRSFMFFICFGLTIIPALVIALVFRPFHQGHIGFLLASIIAGGFAYWTSSNLWTGVYTSRQGVYIRSDSPLRYWVHTSLVGALTILIFYILIHQGAQVAATVPTK